MKVNTKPLQRTALQHLKPGDTFKFLHPNCDNTRYMLVEPLRTSDQTHFSGYITYVCFNDGILYRSDRSVLKPITEVNMEARDVD